MARARQARQAAGPEPAALCRYLLAEGSVGSDVVLTSLALRHANGGRLEDRLVSLSEDRTSLCRLLARFHRLAFVDPLHDPPDAALVQTLTPLRCLRDSVLPWRRVGAATVILCSRPEDFARLRPDLTATLGPVLPAFADSAAIEAAVFASCGRELAAEAECRAPASLSCRGYAPLIYRLPVMLVCLALMALVVVWPVAVLVAISVWVILTLAGVTAIKAAAAWAALRARPERGAPPVVVRLPEVSILVALHHEADIAPRLVARLSRLDYPRDRLEVLLIVEERDRLTREALARSHLPGWMRVVAVPDGRVRTKPRALNHALSLCRGSIVGVYDAEDAPEPDQIAKVVQLFHERGPETVCLQGRLDFYNPTTNWIARCFTMEYAAWFRIVLPGLDRLGLAVPLGGTTLFFRRSALEELGGWDAWNVTEDADLGLRLARRGWRTEVIDTTTAEEANCRALPWIRQRSRWIKGYMITWGVHMRQPRRLWQDLGPWRFAAMQLQFLGTVSQSLFAPLLWVWWSVAFGFPNPISGLMPDSGVMAVSLFFILAQVLDLAIAAIALRQSRQPIALVWVPVLMVYHVMAVPAAWKALWEVVMRPFYWDKTTHGLFG